MTKYVDPIILSDSYTYNRKLQTKKHRRYKINKFTDKKHTNNEDSMDSIT